MPRRPLHRREAPRRTTASAHLGLALVGLAALLGCAPTEERPGAPEAERLAEAEGEGAPTEGAPAEPLSPLEPTPSRLAATPPLAATAVLAPSHLEAAETGTFVLTVTIGGDAGDLPAGTGLLVDFPKPWFAARGPLPKPAQTGDPDRPHFVGARHPGRGADCQVELERTSFDGELERFPHLVRVACPGAPLEPGDEVRIELADTYAPTLAGPGAVRLAVGPDGDGLFRPTTALAAYEVAPLAVAELYLLAPSEAVVGRPLELQVTALDRFHNPAPLAGAELAVRDLAAGPLPLVADPDAPWRATATWSPAATGHRFPLLDARLADGRRLSVAGDPIRVAAEPPAERVVWGDLQSHSSLSKDGLGEGDFLWARDVTRLDFFASTEHADDDGSWEEERDGITPGEWEEIRRRVEELDRPGSFVPLLGYECTLKKGHHCVYFRDTRGFPIAPRHVGWVQKLWRRLPRARAFTIPHHLGRWTGVELASVDGPSLDDVRFALREDVRSGPTLDWSEPHHPAYRPALEIYSLHGSSETYDPDDPLAYENVGYLPSVSAPGPHYARDAWEAGLRMGVVAGSDNHIGRPGLRHGGLTAARVPELTREALFAAIRARRTWATTGARFLLELEIAGARMGEAVTAGGEVEGRAAVASPGPLAFAEVLCHRAGEDGWRTAGRWEAPGEELDAHFAHRVGAEGSTCYLRAEAAGGIGGRRARAWSSPIWLDPPAEAPAGEAGP